MANEANPCPCDIGHKMEYGGLGHEVQIEHMRAYVSKPPVNTGRAVIVIQDIFGWQLPNTRYMADMIAANGYTTILPDFFVGREPWCPSSDWATFSEWLKTRNAQKVDRRSAWGSIHSQVLVLPAKWETDSELQNKQNIHKGQLKNFYRNAFCFLSPPSPLQLRQLFLRSKHLRKIKRPKMMLIASYFAEVLNYCPSIVDSSSCAERHASHV
ncbi:carboxymethylenebutenolidase homolog isoform 2-T2 [Trichechus inunguis]